MEAFTELERGVFVAFIFLMVNLMHDRFSEKPHALFGNKGIEQTK
jgi:hypothetical protein